jgi:hypothetical protein
MMRKIKPLGTEDGILRWMNLWGWGVELKPFTAVIDGCACEGIPYVIAQQITNIYGEDGGVPVWNLKPYQGEHIGTPNSFWLIREVGLAHWNDPNAKCTGTQHGKGIINENGELVGLPDEYATTYNYTRICAAYKLLSRMC